MVGLLCVGRASKCEWTSDAIRDGNGLIEEFPGIGFPSVQKNAFLLINGISSQCVKSSWLMLEKVQSKTHHVIRF